MTTQQVPKPQSIKMGWRLVKSALQTLRLHKKLAVLPVLGALIGAIFLAACWLILAFIMSHVQAGTPAIVAIVALAVFFVLGFLVISSLFDGAVMHGALQAYAGVRTTTNENINAGIKRFWPLFAFNSMMCTVGVVCKIVADRLPIVGNILVNVANTSWNIANYFSIPIIMNAPGNVSPFKATKKSVTLLASIWGASLVTNVGIGSVIFFFTFAYAVLTGLALYAAGTWMPVLTFPLLLVVAFSFIVIGVYAWVLDAITKAALYHYATTQQTPEAFDTAVVQSAMTRRSARKVFSA